MKIETQEGKREFIESFMDSMKEAILEDVAKMPEEWDGFELRWYLQRAFSQEAARKPDPRGSTRLGRYRKFLNEVRVRNLTY